MSLFDEIGKKLAQTSQSAAQKAKDLTETARLNGMISEEEKRINNAFQQIGKAYYETYGRSPDQLFAQLIAGINDSKEKMTAYAEQIKQIKGIANCQKCGGEVPYNAPFCSSCGSPMNTAPVPEASTDSVLCRLCGASVASKAAFCTSCGNKIEQVVDAVPPVEAEPVVVEPQPIIPPEPATTQCPGCGSELATNTAFCLNCGQKI
ncbi:MAG: zinc ribbon domain-containing protein [Oscillospiraceae bacterium]|nr:zinc ribbon domain-containing protein [Oscillospiraceae bacterium]